MEAALHITINRAGDPEKLGALLKAAMDAQERPERIVVPVGYKCVECYRDDGGHESGCQVEAMARLESATHTPTTAEPLSTTQIH